MPWRVLSPPGRFSITLMLAFEIILAQSINTREVNIMEKSPESKDEKQIIADFESAERLVKRALAGSEEQVTDFPPDALANYVAGTDLYKHRAELAEGILAETTEKDEIISQQKDQIELLQRTLSDIKYLGKEVIKRGNLIQEKIDSSLQDRAEEN